MLRCDAIIDSRPAVGPGDPMSSAAAKKPRPKYLSLSALLFEIRLPVPGWVSILHRVSGRAARASRSPPGCSTCSTRACARSRASRHVRALPRHAAGEAGAGACSSGPTAITSAPASATCCSTSTRASSLRPRASRASLVHRREPRCSPPSSRAQAMVNRVVVGAHYGTARLARAARHRGRHGASTRVIVLARADRPGAVQLRRRGRRSSRRAGCASRRCSSRVEPRLARLGRHARHLHGLRQARRPAPRAAGAHHRCCSLGYVGWTIQILWR